MKVNYEMVDLGLPSGLKWAKCNLGAEKETKKGLYFQWGATEGYADASHTTWETAPCHNDMYPMGILNKKYDAVSRIMGLTYRMPTIEDFEELINNTTQKWVTSYKNVNITGILFKSRINNKEVFFPSTSFCRDGYNIKDSLIFMWMSNIHPSDDRFAYHTWFQGPFLTRKVNCVLSMTGYRKDGGCIRGVCE